MTDDNLFGQRLRQLRRECKMTQRRLAAQTGVDHTYLSKIENGELLPGRKTILAIAEALGADSDEFLVRAGKVPADIAAILARNPQLLEVIRAYEKERR